MARQGGSGFGSGKAPFGGSSRYNNEINESNSSFGRALTSAYYNKESVNALKESNRMPDIGAMNRDLERGFLRAESARAAQGYFDGLENTTEERKNIMPSNKIFIVHGHNNEVKLAVSRLLIKLGLQDIILHDQPNKGKTIIEKFESNASEVNFAIVLLTDDDLGRAKTDNNENHRARQNVILELGYFIGKLGRDRVVALKYGDIELPTDILGVVYQTYIPNDQTWQFKIAQELREAGYTIDMNKII